MKLLPLKANRKREGEPMISLLCGAPSLTLGVGAIPLLLSYLIDRPIGSPEFYGVEPVATFFTDATGQLRQTNPSMYYVPSMLLLGVLFTGACCGGLGISLSRRNGRHRPARISAAGLIACVTAFALVWLCLLRVALA